MTAKAVPSRSLLALLYLVGGIIFLDQVTDVAANLLLQPVSPGAANWRFGVFGMATSRASILLIADMVCFIAAVGLKHRRVLRVLAVGHLLLGGLVAAATVLFLLDALEVHRLVGPAGTSSFLAASIRAVVVALFGGVLLLWTGRVAWVASRSSAGRGKSEGGPLLLQVTRQDAG